MQITMTATVSMGTIRVTYERDEKHENLLANQRDWVANAREKYRELELCIISPKHGSSKEGCGGRCASCWEKKKVSYEKHKAKYQAKRREERRELKAANRLLTLHVAA